MIIATVATLIPMPIRGVIRPFQSLLLPSRPYIKVHKRALESESMSQLGVEEIIKLVSFMIRSGIPSKDVSLSFFFLGFSNVQDSFSAPQ